MSNIELLHDERFYSLVCISKAGERMQSHEDLCVNSHSSTVQQSKVEAVQMFITGWELNKMWCLLHLFKKKIVISTCPNLMNLGNMLSWKIQTQKTMCCVTPLVWNTWIGPMCGEKADQSGLELERLRGGWRIGAVGFFIEVMKMF